MDWTRLAEERIEEAIRDGLFDGLPGKGQPLDLDAYFSLPAEIRMSVSILKNAGFRPLEVEMLREIADLEAAIQLEPEGEKKIQLKERLATRRAEWEMLREKAMRQSRGRHRDTGGVL